MTFHSGAKRQRSHLCILQQRFEKDFRTYEFLLQFYRGQWKDAQDATMQVSTARTYLQTQQSRLLLYCQTDFRQGAGLGQLTPSWIIPDSPALSAKTLFGSHFCCSHSSLSCRLKELRIVEMQDSFVWPHTPPLESEKA